MSVMIRTEQRLAQELGAVLVLYGYFAVSCRTNGCDSPAWYREGAEVTARPGGEAMR